MAKRIMVLALALCALAFSPMVRAEVIGTAYTYDELLELAATADSNDVILVSGVLTAAGGDPLSTQVPIILRSCDGEIACIDALQLENADISFDNIALTGTLHVQGTSFIHLSGDVTVTGAQGSEGVCFSGNGSLLADRGSVITGGSESAGVLIHHRSGEFYASLDGHVQGGSGSVGGPGVQIEPMESAGALMISGDIYGGDGASQGGHAVNLFELSGNAYITIDGAICGGSGGVGGNGVQIVSASGQVNVGITGRVTGGVGETFGGDALMLMNVSGASAINLSGTLTGGDVTDAGAQPGTSLIVVGDTTVAHTFVEGCLLQDGRRLAQREPAPLPEITSSIDNVTALLTPEPADVPAGEAAPPSMEIEPEPVVEVSPEEALTWTPQTPEPVIETTPEPVIETTPEMTSVPGDGVIGTAGV